MNEEKSIEATKKGFEASFDEGNLYNRQTQDKAHLNQLIEALHLQPDNTLLDLGTGSGYVSLEVAKRYQDVRVIGLDIVEKTLKANRERADEQHLNNISFVSYDGMNFPFEDGLFDVIVTRYALHHFPNIEHTFRELARVMKKGGRLIIADPTPNDNDTSRFVDAYMKMKPDGHIKYYTKEEFRLLGEKAGFSLIDAFQTEITFPRLKDTANGYETIMKEHSEAVISGYRVHETQDGAYIYITQKVWNLSFLKM